MAYALELTPKSLAWPPSIQITLAIYSQVTEEQDREAAIRAAGLMRR